MVYDTYIILDYLQLDQASAVLRSTIVYSDTVPIDIAVAPSDIVQCLHRDLSLPPGPAQWTMRHTHSLTSHSIQAGRHRHRDWPGHTVRGTAVVSLDTVDTAEYASQGSGVVVGGRDADADADAICGLGCVDEWRLHTAVLLSTRRCTATARPLPILYATAHAACVRARPRHHGSSGDILCCKNPRVLYWMSMTRAPTVSGGAPCGLVRGDAHSRRARSDCISSCRALSASLGIPPYQRVDRRRPWPPPLASLSRTW